jgi:hypothetical protein
VESSEASFTAIRQLPIISHHLDSHTYPLDSRVLGVELPAGGHDRGGCRLRARGMNKISI